MLMLVSSNAFATILLILSLTSEVRAESPQPNGRVVNNFFNVIASEGADPWVYRQGTGIYYATHTTGRDVKIWRSSTLTGLFAGKSRTVWIPPAKGSASRDIWAPELHRLRGKWYIYYAADDGDNANHRMYVLENAADDPFEGEFIPKGRLFDPENDRWAIDGTVFEHDRRLYFLWSGWEGSTNVDQRIYIAPMRNPWTLDGPRVEISRPTLPWETRGAPPAINEGPQVLVKGERVHVVYSASGSWTDDYCLGLLTAESGHDLLTPETWTKHPDPVFQRRAGVDGPGHCSFTTSPDGTEDCIVYHAAQFRGAGWARNVRVQRFSWDSAGFPVFGTPHAPNVPESLPGGEPPRLRFEAEMQTDLGSGTRVVIDREASGKAALALVKTNEGSVRFDVKVKEPGPYHLWIRFRNASGRRFVATHKLSVNDGPVLTVRYPYTGPSNWSNVVVRVELKARENRLQFDKGSRIVEIDEVDLVRERP